MNENLINAATAARKKKEDFLRRIKEMKAEYHEADYEYDTPAFYSFNLFSFFNKDEVNYILTCGQIDLIMALYDKTMQESAYTGDQYRIFDNVFAETMVSIWSLQELKNQISGILTSQKAYSYLPHFTQAIIKTDNHELIMLMLDKSFISGICPESQKMIFARKNEDEVFYLFHQYNLSHRPVAESQELANFQISILSRACSVKHYRLVNSCKLMNAAQVFMYDMKMKDLYRHHLNLYGVCQELQMIAMQQKDKTMLYDIIDRHCLAPYGATDYFVKHSSDDDFFRYKHRLNSGAELILLKQDNSNRIYYYIDKFGLYSENIGYLIDKKKTGYLSAFVKQHSMYSENLRKFAKIASPEDLLNNLSNLPPHYSTDVDLCFEKLIPYPEILIKGLKKVRCSQVLAARIFKESDFEVQKTMVLYNYSRDYEEFIFANSDWDMLQTWHKHQYGKKSLPENISFKHFSQKIIRFLIDNYDFTAEQEQNLLRERDENDAQYYMMTFYPNL